MPVPSKYALHLSEEEIQDRLDELLELERAALEPSTQAVMEVHRRCYSLFCQSVHRQDFPVSYESLGLYLVQYCKKFGNTARSIPSILSHLKRANRHHGPWLDEYSALRLHDVITSLRKTDPVPPRRKLPCTHDVLLRMERTANPRQHSDYQIITMCRTAHDALLRGGELVNLRVGHARWSPDRTSVTLTVHYSKANKRVAQPEQITIVDYGPSSAVAWLRQYWQVMGLANRPPAYPVWPTVNHLGHINYNTFTTKQQFITRVRTLLGRVGYPAHAYSGHSFRSGGATDLWASHKCRSLTIKLHGRWRSDAWKVYVRDNPFERAEEVAAALAFFHQAAQP